VAACYSVFRQLQGIRDAGFSAIVYPPRPVGQWTDVSNFRQLKSGTRAERTRSNEGI